MNGDRDIDTGRSASDYPNLLRRIGGLTTTQYAIGLISVCAIGLIFRAVNINSEPFWMDEAFSYYAARNSVSTIVFGRIDNHPPLFYLIQHFWQSFFPSQEMMRVPALFAGILTIAVTGLMGADLLNRSAGLAAALIVALSASQIYFSLDTRMYTLIALGCSLATWGGAGLTRRMDRTYYILYILGAAVAIYSQFITLIYLLGLNLAVAGGLMLSDDRIQRLLRLLAANCFLLLLVIPGFVLATSAAGSFPGLGVTALSDVPWFFKNTFGFPGIVGPSGLLLFLGVSLFFLASAVMLIRSVPRIAAVLVFSLVFYSLGIVVIDQAFLPILANRILIPAVVPFALVLGAGFLAFRSRAIRLMAIAAMLCIGGFSALVVRGEAPKVEDVPGALAYAKGAGFDRTPIATCDLFTSSTASLYAQDRPILWLHKDGTVIDFTPQIIGGIPISQTRDTNGATLIRRLESKHLASSGRPKLAAANRVVALEAVCKIDKLLKDKGFTRTTKRSLQSGPAIMEAVWTEVSLWQRIPSKN